ncbi:MAG: hypothetical protein FP816_13655 [Desulfobacteraceae bacterium]|nr:hypothetical protein [Desulfobacteraceae bacterium]
MTYSGAYIPPAKNGSYPLRSGNRVFPLIDGAPAFRRICEAVDNAEHSVWVTMAFIETAFKMPDGKGSFFDVMDRARARGLDVRVLFWRSPEVAEMEPDAEHFLGTAEHRKFLALRGSQFMARWDRLTKTWCHHQKSWLMDAGRDTEIAFVGGINLDVNSVVEPGHHAHEAGSTHDLFVEVRGPSATDVHHNFVQRWNGASEKDLADGSWPENDKVSDLPFPESLSASAGDSPVQISRTVRRGTYQNAIPAVGAEPFPIVQGEQSCLEQYIAAIDSARETIYIEDQVLMSFLVLEKLEKALERGVEIICVLPGKVWGQVLLAFDDPRMAPFFDKFKSLERFPHFTLAALAANREPGKYLDVYVHAKIAMVDGVWATIGSCNIADRSFYSDTELNASFWDGKTARKLRNDLFKEHLEVEVSGMTDKDAMQLFRETAKKNTARRVRGEALQGLAFQLDPAHYPSAEPWLPELD